jgi:hypothetical protein
MKEQTFILQRAVERNLSRIVAFLSGLSEDKAWKVSVVEFRQSRSNEQNASLYGVAYKALGEFTGYTAPELHDVFLRAYFGEVEIEIMGTTIKRPRRTTTTDERGARSLLTTSEFQDFYSFVQQKGAEIGCFVPDPDPMWNLNKEHAA